MSAAPSPPSPLFPPSSLLHAALTSVSAITAANITGSRRTFIQPSHGPVSRVLRAEDADGLPRAVGAYTPADMPSTADKTQWFDLYHEVVMTGICTGCTACIVACPFHVLGYEDDVPVQLQDEGVDQCAHGERGCDICTRACPRFRDWEGEVDMTLFGMTRKPEDVIGHYKDIWL